MDKDKIPGRYKNMSAEDRRTFNRWLALNAAVGFAVAIGLVAMAWPGSNSRGMYSSIADRDKDGF
jgi:hypothetical protein